MKSNEAGFGENRIEALLKKALRYNEQVQTIIERLEDDIGDKMRGVYMSQDSVGGDAIEINQKLEAAAAELSQIGELRVTREELYDLMQERLGLTENVEPAE